MPTRSMTKRPALDKAHGGTFQTGAGKGGALVALFGLGRASGMKLNFAGETEGNKLLMQFEPGAGVAKRSSKERT